MFNIKNNLDMRNKESIIYVFTINMFYLVLKNMQTICPEKNLELITGLSFTSVSYDNFLSKQWPTRCTPIETNQNK